MTARFNTYFNGAEAFKEGVLEQQKGHKDNYTDLLPMYAVRNKSTAAMGKSNFETTIEKCEKAIKLHSIKARPKSNVNKRKTAKEKAYMARKGVQPILAACLAAHGGKRNSNRAISSKRPPRSIISADCMPDSLKSCPWPGPIWPVAT